MPETILFSPGGASEETLLELLDLTKAERRLQLDYTGGPTASDPVYIGVGAFDATVAQPVWTIRKLTYTSGNVTSLELRTATAWVNRADPTPPWET